MEMVRALPQVAPSRLSRLPLGISCFGPHCLSHCLTLGFHLSPWILLYQDCDLISGAISLITLSTLLKSL